MKFRAKPLPYTMGNSGDLIKHGLLTEFIAWYCEHSQSPMEYYDPFGGRPWQEPIHKLVEKRLTELRGCYLHDSQVKHRYWGSGQLVSHLVAVKNGKIKVFCSDRDENARYDLESSGLKMIALADFNHQDAYSILNCKMANDCILLDPFDELEWINEQVLSKVMDKVIQQRCYVFLFVLYQAKELSLWRNFQQIQRELVGKSVAYLSLSCPPLVNSEITGESKFYSHIVLYLPNEHSQPSLASLVKNVEKYALNLQKVLNSPISFSYQF